MNLLIVVTHLPHFSYKSLYTFLVLKSRFDRHSNSSREKQFVVWCLIELMKVQEVD